MYRDLPNGTWITFGGLTPETTDVEVQAYLAAAGIEVSLERISVSARYDRAASIVSLPQSEIQSLVERATGDVPLNGRVPKIVVPSKSNR
jgi:hypothetical protein